jgi:hypothetical protein
MPARSNANGVMFSEPTYSEPIESDIERGDDGHAQPPAPIAEGEFDWNGWIEGHKDALADEILRATARLVVDRCGDLADKIAAQAKTIAALELKLAEMRGAVDVLRGKGAPGAFNIKGTFDGSATYNFLDVVAVGNSSFVARCDRPGACPGPNWQLLAGAGRRGPRGERGVRGPIGEPATAAPTFVGWHIDRANYEATLVMSNGSIAPTLQLRGLFEQFIQEMREAAK